MKFSWKGEKLCQLSFKYIWVHVRLHQYKLARRGVLEYKLGYTWVENAWGALCRQVFRSRACEAEECNFNPNVYEEAAKYPNAKLVRWGVFGKPPSFHWDESVEVLPLLLSTSYEYNSSKQMPYSTVLITTNIIQI